MKLPSNVSVCEVAPRDGFQAQHEWIPTEKTLKLFVC
jgi:hydroxymethylglutaryl-CoA lyase